MEWDSSPRNLFVLGISLLILGTSVPPTDTGLVWVGSLGYYFCIVGVTLIMAAMVTKIRER